MNKFSDCQSLITIFYDLSYPMQDSTFFALLFPYTVQKYLISLDIKETLKRKYHLIKNNNDKKETLEIIYGNNFLTILFDRRSRNNLWKNKLS